MIHALELRNFQSHKDSYFEFSTGVNVIIGKSDQGKSSIVRALTWAFKNRPTGNGFINFNLENKDTCSVGVEFENNDYILREKNNSINSYTTFNGEEKELKALRSDVPEEVQSITKIKDVNLQSQHEEYFLLGNSPGQVAKAFNEVAGLQVMDTVLQKINSLVRKSTGDIKYKDAEISKTEKQIKNLEWVSEADKKYKAIEALKLEIDEKTKFLLKLDRIVEELESVNAEIYTLKQIIPANKELQNLETLYNEIVVKNKKQEALYRLIPVLKFSDTALKGYRPLSTALTSFKQIKNTFKELNTKKENLHRTKKCLSTISDMDKRIINLKNEIDTYTEEYNAKLKNLGKCPMCGGKV